MSPLFDLNTITITRSAHRERSARLSLMEAVAWAAGEPHTDTPECVCPIIAAFTRNWNDSLPTDEERALLLRPLVPQLIDCRRNPTVESERAYLALDWLVRIHLPAWLHMTESLRKYTKTLYDLPEIKNAPRSRAAMPMVNATREAARFAAASSSWCASWASRSQPDHDSLGGPAQSAAWIIAGHVAGEALKAAAATSARAAARSIASEAAWDAWDAAREAAWAAAGPPALEAASKHAGVSDLAAKKSAEKAAVKTLHFTVARLQLSAVDLLHQMIGCR